MQQTSSLRLCTQRLKKSSNPRSLIAWGFSASVCTVPVRLFVVAQLRTQWCVATACCCCIVSGMLGPQWLFILLQVIVVHHWSSFLSACGRIQVRVLGEGFTPEDEEDSALAEVSKVWAYQARYRVPLTKATAGTSCSAYGVVVHSAWNVVQGVCSASSQLLFIVVCAVGFYLPAVQALECLLLFDMA